VKKKAYVGKTLMKFEEMGITVNGQPVNIKPANLFGFMPVFAAKKDAKAAGWNPEDVMEIKVGK